MNKKLETQKIKLRLGEFLNDGNCFVCEKSKSRKGFTIHHCRYIFNDIVYKNYPKTTEGQLKYYQDLEPRVMETPNDFLFLCNGCHQALERLNRFAPKKLIRLLMALLLTDTNGHNAELKKLLKDAFSTRNLNITHIP